MTAARSFGIRLTLPLAFLGLIVGISSAQKLSVDDVMYQDPLLVLPQWSPAFSEKLKPLWLQALDRPDGELRRLAADTITIAVGYGMQGLEEATLPLQNIVKSDSDPLIRRAAARALVALNAKTSASVLAEAAAQDGLLMAQIVEPALAKWNEAPIHEVWLQRLKQPDVERGMLLLAIEGLGTTRELRAEPLLTASLLTNASAPRDLRLAAARAIGRIREAGLDEQARALAASAQQPEFLGRLLAVNLLIQQHDANAVELLRRLAIDQEPAVACAALGRLREIDRQLALPLAGQAIANRDAGVRRIAIELLAERSELGDVRSLGPHLNDRNPGIRQLVAFKLVEFAERGELQAEVLQQANTMLGSDQWRGQEQAALVLGRLDHKPAASRLLELLSSSRGEPAVAAAWALRKLRVAETLPKLLTHAEAMHKDMVAAAGPRHAGPEIRQILQLFGEVKYRESEPLLRKFLPKSSLDQESRGAACWSLGWLYEGQPDPQLAKAFADRLADIASIPAECGPVRQMTAIGLGRMAAREELPGLRRFLENDTLLSNVGAACGWSIEHLTGEKIQPAPPQKFGIVQWFLEAVDP